MNVQNQRWVTIHVACSSIVAKQGAEETSEKSNFHAGSRGWGGVARTSRTQRPRAPRASNTRAEPRHAPASHAPRRAPTAARCTLSTPDSVAHGGLIKGLWVWQRPSRSWVSLSPDHINSCSFLSSLKGDVTPAVDFCVIAINSRLC